VTNAKYAWRSEKDAPKMKNANPLKWPKGLRVLVRSVQLMLDILILMVGAPCIRRSLCKKWWSHLNLKALLVPGAGSLTFRAMLDILILMVGAPCIRRSICKKWLSHLKALPDAGSLTFRS
jgi:hypothetical protein